MQNVLVTGGSGFIGTNLVEHYAHLGCNVLNIDIVPPRNPTHLCFWKKLDILDGGRLRKLVHSFLPTLIMHMAARTDLEGKSLSDYVANTDGVKEIIEAASNLPNPPRVIFASSMLVCLLGYLPKSDSDYCPTTSYGESKVVGEQYVRKLATGRFTWTIVRPTSLWGPWFGVPYKDFFDAVAKGRYLHPQGREIRRSYGFVLNAVHQLSQIASCQDGHLVDNKVFYLADYQPIEIFHWAKAISKQFGVSPPRNVPVGILKLSAWVGDCLKKSRMMPNPLLTSFRLNNLLTEAVFDLSGLERIAGPTPYDMEQGIAATVDWIQRSGKQ